MGEVVGVIILAIIALPITAICMLGFLFGILLETPYELIMGYGFYDSNWLMWLMIGSIVLTIIGAARFHLGEFMADSSYVSGHHWEFSVSGDTVTATKVDEYSGGGEWIINLFLFLVRMLIIAFAGWIIFIYKIAKSKRNK